LSDPDYLNIGLRHISISTSGHADNIRRLAEDLPQVNLAVSVHTGVDEERDDLVPMNRKFNLETLAKAIEFFIQKTGRQVFIEYTLIDHVNDTPKHIRMLNKWIQSIKDNYLIHINLIACNPTDGEPEKKSRTGLEDFSAGLTGCGLKVSIRRSLGVDIGGACGQLAGK
jgi:23S rRNA (adenine2503-C2)-methyltransferase